MGKILCGDSLELLRTLDSESIDLCITDPPYGINYISNRQGVDRKISVSRRKDVVVRDKYFESISNDTSLPIEWLSEVFRLLRPNTAMYVFCHWSHYGELESAVKRYGFVVKNMLVMNKSNHGMGDLKGQYAPKHELVLYAVKGRHLLQFPNGRSNDVLDVPIKFTGSKRLHPNEKPLSWFTTFLQNSSKEGDIVLDPFCGSGSTLVAADVLKRDFIGIDIEYKWADLSANRLGVSVANLPGVF